MSTEYIKRERFESNFAMVPKPALKDPKLSLKAKGLYSYLFSLPEDWKVYKTEIVKHFSDGKDSMNAAFKELEENGYLTSLIIRDEVTQKFKGTILTLSIEPLRISRSGKPDNGKPATTNTVNTNNSLPNGKRTPTQRKPRIKKEFVPPALDDVKEYFKENGYTSESANTAFKYYTEADWHDASGKPVKNWKQKMISVWFKKENQIPVMGTNNSQPQQKISL